MPETLQISLRVVIFPELHQLSAHRQRAAAAIVWTALMFLLFSYLSICDTSNYYYFIIVCCCYWSFFCLSIDWWIDFLLLLLFMFSGPSLWGISVPLCSVFIYVSRIFYHFGHKLLIMWVGEERLGRERIRIRAGTCTDLLGCCECRTRVRDLMAELFPGWLWIQTPAL